MDAQERENALSVRRSTVAAHRDGPAGDTDTPESVRNVIASPGQSLDTSIQRAMEDRMGDSLGDVRVHTGPQAAKACEAINARAFTVGNHIAFNHGEYDPSSPDGQHVLAHELAHVRQQTGGAVSMLPQENLELEIDPEPQLERDAEETAQRVMEGGELGIQRMKETEVHVQRMGLGVFTGSGTSEGPIEQLRSHVEDATAAGEEKVDDLTTKTYRLTRDQLLDMVESVETPKGLADYLEHHDIDVASRIQDAASSSVKGATKGWTVGSMAGSLAGPVGAAAGGLLGVPLGALLTTKFGEQTAGKIQNVIRNVLGLKTDQEFDSEDLTSEGDDPLEAEKQ
ncbi:eCIS core domain-containing protein [Natrinema altunense]|uniref:DUF4157 domain-containing protein n=1 Tax=Natrinema altunense TaxID=222984 RepID=A0A482Y5B0_9EURY|nr:DUF4157 domain-containing protein [Natrinema altunense]RZH69335.1 DUF4157 domain-containing protein [Natrinema altunense]